MLQLHLLLSLRQNIVLGHVVLLPSWSVYWRGHINRCCIIRRLWAFIFHWCVTGIRTVAIWHLKPVLRCTILFCIVFVSFSCEIQLLNATGIMGQRTLTVWRSFCSFLYIYQHLIEACSIQEDGIAWSASIISWPRVLPYKHRDIHLGGRWPMPYLIMSDE